MITIHKNEDTFPNHPHIDCVVWILAEGEKVKIGKVKVAAQPGLFDAPESVRNEFDAQFEENVVSAFLIHLHAAPKIPDNVECVRIVNDMFTSSGWSIVKAIETKNIWITVIT